MTRYRMFKQVKAVFGNKLQVNKKLISTVVDVFKCVKKIINKGQPAGDKTVSNEPDISNMIIVGLSGDNK